MPILRRTPKTSQRKHTTTTTTPRRSHRNRHAHTHTTTTGHTTTTTTKPTLLGRLRGERTVRHQKHHASVGDKISGELMKIKGSLTRRPGEKAAGTRRKRGTDGRGARRSKRVVV